MALLLCPKNLALRRLWYSVNMTEHHDGIPDALEPARLRDMAERVLGQTVATEAPAPPAAAEAPDKAELDAQLTEQLNKDLADPSTFWQAYSSPAIGLVSPDTIRSTRRDEEPAAQVDKYHRMNKVGGPEGEPLGTPGASLSKNGAVVRPRTPAIREGLAAGEGILLSFDRGPTTPAARVAYFLDEKAGKVDLVSFRKDGTTRTLTITDPALAPKSFTVGEAGQFSPAVNEKLSGLKLASVELPSTMMERLDVIDPDGIPTVLPEGGRVQYARGVDPTVQAQAALEFHTELSALPTAPPRP